IVEIRRVRDEFLDAQIRHEKHRFGFWDSRREVLQQVEDIFLEPTESGLNTVLEEFWAAWQELSKHPESVPTRVNLREKAKFLTDRIKLAYGQLETLAQEMRQEIETKVQQVNSLVQEIHTLNESIMRVKSSGQQPNDFLDKRDLLLDRLAELVDYQVKKRSDGRVEIYLQGKPLLQARTVQALETVVGPQEVKVVWKGDQAEVGLTGGRLTSLLQSFNEVLPAYRAKLNDLARKLTEEVNSLHRTGYGLDGQAGRDFFVPLDGDPEPASHIAVSNDILADPAFIGAASQPGAPGDGSIALEIARLSRERVFPEGGNPTFTFGDYYQNIVAELGVQTDEGNRMVEVQEHVLEQLETRREAVAGVSLDEELANMVQFQQAYAAAARVISVIDEMLDILINRTGR
ncbi:flagellar hook-associated protein FlgK, partial [Calderihabitans maritimus]